MKLLFFNFKIAFLVVMLQLLSAFSFGQTPSNVIVNIAAMPPYSPYLTDYFIYDNQTVMTVTAIGAPGETYQIYFNGSIIGDNGISIKTRDSHYPSQPFVIQANVPTVLKGMDLQDMFDWGNVDIVGVSIKNVIRTNGVPEGNYRICLQAYDYQTRQMIGVESCSSPIMIQHVNPPMLTAPVCDAEILQTRPQNMMFSWTYNPGVTSSVRYLLKIVELLDTQNPYDAINSQTTPAFFEKSVSSINYLYTAIDPVLKPGKKYAWRVKAYDLNNKIKFKNNGESEVCVFQYKSDNSTINQDDITSTTESHISGKANYYFVEENTVPAHNGVRGNIVYYPLKNTPIQLIETSSLAEVFKVKKVVGKESNGTLKYAMVDSISPFQSSEFLMGSIKPDPKYPKTMNVGQVIASSMTDELGNYSFNIPSTFQSQIIDTFNVSAAESTDGKSHRAAFVTGLWIRYDNHYYYSGGQVIFVTGKTLIDNIFTAQQAKNYSLKVNLKNYNQSKDYYKNQLIPTEGKVSDEVVVYVLKKKKSINTPFNECGVNGQPISKIINNRQYWVYAQKTAKQNESVTFNDLIQNIYAGDGIYYGDPYYIYAEPKDAKNVKYQPVKYNWSACSGNDCYGMMQFDMNMSQFVKKELDISPYHVSLAISGKLKRVFANDGGTMDYATVAPLANIPIKLVGQWVIKSDADQQIYPINGNSYDFAAGTTNADGEFTLNTGNTSFLMLGANGMNQYQNSTGDYYAKDGSTKQISGKEYYVLRIVVQSPYYYSPDLDLLVEPGYNYELGDLYSFVREANVKIDGVRAINNDINIFESGGFFNPVKKSGEKVYLCIKPTKIPSDFPRNQNKIYSMSRKEIESGGYKFQVIDETVSLSGGICQFKHLVLNDPNNSNDRYYYFTESGEQSFDNYSSENVNVLKACLDQTNEQETYYNSQRFLKTYNKQKDLHELIISDKIYTFAQTPVISGAVYPESNYSTNPLNGVKVEVYDIPDDAVNNASFGLNGFSGAWFCGTLKADGLMPEATMVTGANGKFLFNVNTSNPSKTNRKLVLFSKNGFTPYGFFVNGGAVLKKGQKAALGKVFLNLPATVLGKVVDAETGEFIHAKIVVGDDFSWSETEEQYGMIKIGNMNVPGPIATGQKLIMSAPFTNNVKFTVYPFDNDKYETLIDYHDIPILGSQPNFTFKVKKRQHHIVIRAHFPGSDYVKNTIPIRATILNTNPEIPSVSSTVNEKDNNNQSVKVYQASLDFPSSAKSFLVKIESLAEGNCYESKIVSIEDEAKYLHTFNFELKPCKKIICHVDDDKGQPAANVKLYVEGLEYTVPEVYTNVNGDAEIMGVPADGSHVIVAIPPTTMKNYYGSKKTVNVATYQGAKINMKVNYFSAMDITSLVGFPIEVTTITMGIGPNLGKFYISGNLLVKTGNTIFKIPSVNTGVASINKNNNYGFEFVEIIPSASLKGSTGIALAVPKTDFWSTTTLKAISVFNSYDAYSYSAFGTFVKKISENSGKLQAPVGLEPAMFKKGFTIQNIDNSIYLNTLSYTGKTAGVDIAEFLDLFMSDGTTSSTLGTSFKTSKWNYKNFFYTLHSRYNSEAIIEGSTFDKDGLHLNTIIHTNISQLQKPDINLNVGTLNVSTTEVESFYSTTPVDISMDKWKFNITKLTLNESGLVATGKILAGAITVPAKEVLIDNTRFNYGTYDVDAIKLGGNIPLNLDKNNTSVSFGYDQAFGPTGSWSLSMLPLKGDVLTSIKKLPGLAIADQINLKNISLYSKGSDDENIIMISESTPWVTLHGVTKFHPSMAYATTGAINFRGKLDLQIAKMSDLVDAFTLRYEAKPSGLTLLPQDELFANLSMNTMGVKVIFDTKNQEFSDNKLVLHGKIYDQNPSVNYAFDVTFMKTNLTSSIIVDGNTQKFVYSGGASGLEKISGSMFIKPNNAEWNNFAFEGDVYGLQGLSDDKKHMKFKVEGDIVANNHSVGVNNIAIDGLGTGSLTYDFSQKALVGSLHIDRDLSNCHLAGDVDLKLGGGDWYIFGSTIATNIKNSPVNSAKCGFFVGKGSISGNIQNVLAQYFYQQLLPDPFPKGNYIGALFCTEAAMPVPIIPQIDIDLDPIVHCTLEHAIHMNCYTGLSLDYPKISYDLGGQIYAYIHAGAGASIGIACVGADFKATAGAGMYGHIDLNIPGLSLNPVQMMSGIKDAIENANITLQGEVFMDLQGTAYVGGGLCDSDCDGWFCETTSWSKGMDIILTATYKRGDGLKVEGKKWNFH